MSKYEKPAFSLKPMAAEQEQEQEQQPLPKVYDASCPHCGHVQAVKLKGLFGTAEKGKRGVICKGEQCGMPFTVAWKEGEGVEVRRER